MVRKEFIKQASLLVGNLTIAPALSEAIGTLVDRQMVIKLKKGLGYGMIKEALPLVDKLKLVKDLGFDGVEFNSPVDISFVELLEAKNKVGIEIPSVVNTDHWSKPLSDPDASVRQHTIDSVAKSLEEVKELGGDTVLVVPGVVKKNVSYEVAYMNALESMRKLIPHVEKTGIKIGLENVWNNFLLSPIEVKRFLDEVNHPLIGWYFDVGNIFRYGWPEHWIVALGSRIVKLHAKEFSYKKMNENGLWKGFDVALGEGDVDWRQVMNALRKIDYGGGWLISELPGGDRHYLKDVSKKMDEILVYYRKD